MVLVKAFFVMKQEFELGAELCLDFWKAYYFVMIVIMLFVFCRNLEEESYSYSMLLFVLLLLLIFYCVTRSALQKFHNFLTMEWCIF